MHSPEFLAPLRQPFQHLRKAAVAGALILGLSACEQPSDSPIADTDQQIEQTTDVSAATLNGDLTRGVWLPSGEYACTQQNTRAFYVDTNELLSNVSEWGFNTVRVSLNSSCWNGNEESFSADTYKNQVLGMVESLSASGINTILDLHWSAPSGFEARSQQAGPTNSSDLDFWRDLAKQLVDMERIGAITAGNVSLELFNEPYDIPPECWQNGCDYNQVDVQGAKTQAVWQVAGMQQMIDAVRSTGATYPIIINGLEWANDTTVLTERFAQLTDPANNLQIGFHVYPFNACSTIACFDEKVAPLVQIAPVTITEFGVTEGENPVFVADVISWAEENGIGWVATSYLTDVHGVMDPQGTPTVNGKPVYDALHANNVDTTTHNTVAGQTPPVSASSATQPPVPSGQASTGECPVDFSNGQTMPETILCSDGRTIIVSGTSMGGWNGKASYAATTDGITANLLFKDYGGKYDAATSNPSYIKVDSVTGGNFVEPLNDTLQSMTITPNGTCGTVTISSEGNGAGQIIRFSTCQVS